MLRTLALTTSLSLLAAPTLARENYALLIGADKYPSLDERYWLKGPSNDVKLVETYLTTQSPVPFAQDHILVLSDAIEGATPPTLAAIRAGFADLTAKVKPGDFVYLHFSGHGSQAPARDPSTEVDGLDELFLPVDIGVWEKSVGSVENALVDDEIGTLIDGLRQKGADVWAVFDSCHSGTVTRGAPESDEVRPPRSPPPPRCRETTRSSSTFTASNSTTKTSTPRRTRCAGWAPRWSWRSRSAIRSIRSRTSRRR